MGNRDINKMRLTAELEACRKFSVFDSEDPFPEPLLSIGFTPPSLRERGDRPTRSAGARMLPTPLGGMQMPPP